MNSDRQSPGGRSAAQTVNAFFHSLHALYDAMPDNQSRIAFFERLEKYAAGKRHDLIVAEEQSRREQIIDNHLQRLEDTLR